MRLKTELAVFLLFAGWAGWSASGLGGDSAAPLRRGGARPGTPQEYLPVPIPDVAAALPPDGRDAFYSRDLFAPPSDTSPLPLLDLVLPPIEPLAALAPPTAYGPGPSGAHLLRTALEIVPVPGLFGISEDDGGDAVVDLEPIDPLDMTPEQRSARLQALKKLHDWIVVRGLLHFGQIRNKRRFDLARLNEEVLFVEIDPDTGLERFPGQAPLGYERSLVTDFGLADTPLNFIELRLREFPVPLRHGDLEAALTFAGECVELRNETPRGLEVAEQMYRRLAEANPTDVRPPLGLAGCYELGFRFEEAFGVYRGMTEDRFQAEPEPWARLADLLARFRLFGRAEEAFREALRRRSTNWEARWRYGRFLLARGRADEALGNLEEAARREPASGDLRWARVALRADLGACLLYLGRAEEAHTRFEQAYQADPSQDLGLAGMYSAALFVEGAQQPDLDAVAGDTPDASFDLLLALGLQGIQQGDAAAARRHLERAAATDPFRAWMAWRALSWLAEITGHPEEAYAFIERAYLSEPTDPWTLYQLGRLLAKQDDLPGAMQAFKAALDRDLDFSDALIGLGRLYQLAGEHEAAERYYERALSVDPRRPVVHGLRGFNHFQLGEPGAAGDDFDRAISLDPDLPSPRNGQAWWFYAHGDTDEALTRFDGVVDSRRNAPADDPHRAYADAQSQRILDHEGKEVWTDRFDRVGTLGNAWSLDESDGVVSKLDAGQVWLEGRFERSGQARIYQTLPAERFVSFAATVTLLEGPEGRMGVFVARESPGSRDGQVRVTSRVALRRNNKDGAVQATFIRKGQHEAEVVDLFDHSWPIGKPMRVRIEIQGEGAEASVSLWLDDLPVMENIGITSLGSSQPLRFGFFVEGDRGRSARVSIDDVNVVRRK